MDEAIIKLQILAEHQETEIQALSKELYTQQKELAQLRLQLAELTERLYALENDPGTALDADDEPPPPHY